MKTFNYAYDSAQNRANEQVDGGTIRTASYNALNELTTVDGSALPQPTKWDAEQRLTAVRAGNQSTEFSYDGFGRRIGIRELTDGIEVSDRRFIWCGPAICEERTAAGEIVKRFFPQGMKAETGAAPGRYFYTKDHRARSANCWMRGQRAGSLCV